MSSEPRFRWWSLGGLGEVGMNCMVFDFGGTVLPVDAGILFADSNDFGIEALHPDYEGLLKSYKPSHWLITHAHEDHIGAIPAIFSICAREGLAPPQILAPHFAAALIRRKLSEEGGAYPGARKFADHVVGIDADTELDVGEVSVRFVEIRHSTPQSASLAFTWRRGAQTLRAFHTADFKLDFSKYVDGVKDFSTYDVFGGQRPDLLFIDSTNAEREGHTVSEAEVAPRLEQLIAAQSGRVFVTLFSSNIYRIGTLLELARRTGRHVCLAGRSMGEAFRAALELGLFGREAPDFEGTQILSPEEMMQQVPSKQLILCSGSQGEYRSVLFKMSLGQHPHFQVQPGDAVVFSSKLIPGNEKTVSRLINGLLRQGARVLYGDEARHEAGGPIHASGHARGGEIRQLMEHFKPAHIVPVHGELRQLLSCAAIARTAGAGWGLEPDRVHVTENGTELVFEPGPQGWNLAERNVDEACGRILRFESFAAPSRDGFLRARKRAAAGGIVAAALDSSGRARVQLSGLLPEALLSEELRGQIEAFVRSQYRQIRSTAFSREDTALEDELAADLARFVRRLTGVRPFALFQLLG